MKVGSLIKKIRLLFDQEQQAAETAAMPTVAQVSPPQSAVVQQAPPRQVVIPMPSAPAKRKPTLPPPPTVSIKDHSDCILRLIGESAKVFVAFADAKKYTENQSVLTSEALHRPDVTALMLGYKLVLSAYRTRYKESSREVMRTVRSAIMSMLLKAGRDHTHQVERQRPRDSAVPAPILSLPAAEEHLRGAEQEISTALESSPISLNVFYSALSPAFGATGAVQENTARYSAVVEDLYRKADQAIAHQLSTTAN